MISRLFTIIAVFILASSCNENKDLIHPERRDITEWVYASVTVRPDSMYKAYATVSGILEDVMVKEGDSVDFGAALFKIRNTNPELQVKKLKLDYDLALEYLNQQNGILKSLKDQINAVQLRHRNDSLNYCRQANLWSNSIGSKAEYEAKKLAFELSGEELNKLQSDYARTRKELEIKANQAELALRSSRVTSADFIVRSEVNGKVYDIYKAKGEVVSSQQPLGVLGSATNFILELLVDEVDIVKIIRGQFVLVSLDAYPKHPFKARISRIIPDKDARNQTFKVEALFVDQPKVLYPGLSGEANIAVNHKENALVIPIRYLFNDTLVQAPDSLITVKTGLRNFEFVEVTQGLNEQSRIILPEK